MRPPIRSDKSSEPPLCPFPFPAKPFLHGLGRGLQPPLPEDHHELVMGETVLERYKEQMRIIVIIILAIMEDHIS
jgi:hypothetical protein